MSGHCGSCKHWQQRQDDEEHGLCLLIGETARLGEGDRLGAYRYSSKLAMVVVQGQRYVDSGLLTHADFGCVQFEERP